MLLCSSLSSFFIFFFTLFGRIWQPKTFYQQNISYIIYFFIIILCSFLVFAIIYLYDSIWFYIFFNCTLISSLWLCCYTNSSWPHSWKWKGAVLDATYQVTALANRKSYLHYFLFSYKAFVGKLPVAGRVTLDLYDSCAVSRAATDS